jgi:outer membrane immunogenic protein
MKKFLAVAAFAALSSATAFAADLPVKAPLLSPAPAYSWTGFYVGGHVGAGWGRTETALTSVSAPIVPLNNYPISLAFSQNSRSGILGGAQAGYNWQTGWAVLGVQADIAGMDVKGTTPCLLILSCTDKSNWLATVSGRFGAVFMDRGLVYAKGGVAWLNTNHSVNTPSFGLGIPIPNQIANRDSTAWGWLIGMGAEYMITKNWTAFIEYDYIEFDKKNEAFALNLGGLNPPGGVTINADIKNALSIAKVGANYKF